MNVYIKKRGRLGVVYMDGNVSMPIADMDDEPGGFPFTARFEEVKARFPGANFIVIEDKKEPPTSGAIISDEQLLRSMPEAKAELGPQKLVHTGVPNAQPALQLVAAATPPPPTVNDVGRKALDVFRDTMRRYHYARGKERKELGRDLEAVASFLIEVDPALEAVLERIKVEETLERKRFTL